MAAEIIPFQQRPIKWAAPAFLVGVSSDIPACLKAWYVLQCIEYPIVPAKEKVMYLLRTSGAFYSTLYGEWIHQCQSLADSDVVQREIGNAAKKTRLTHTSHLSRNNQMHTSIALREKSSHLEDLWWEMSIDEKPRIIKSIWAEFETELMRLQ